MMLTIVASQCFSGWLATTKQHTTAVYHLLGPNPLFLREPTCEDVATVDTMYDKYDIPYDTIWPLDRRAWIGRVFDSVSAIYENKARPAFFGLVGPRKA